MGERIQPFRILGDLWYVGLKSVSVHLFASDQGHILLDAGLPGTGPEILAHVVEAGFRPADIRYLLLTHAHLDHLGGAAHIQRETGATVCLGEADWAEAAAGDPAARGLRGFEPVTPDRPLRDGEAVEVGPWRLRALHTPGHTPGCFSFQFEIPMSSGREPGFLFGGPGMNPFRRGSREYGGTADQFRRTLDRIENLEVRLWLAGHPSQNRTFEKRDALLAGAAANPFLDPAGWKTYLAGRREALKQAEEMP